MKLTLLLALRWGDLARELPQWPFMVLAAVALLSIPVVSWLQARWRATRLKRIADQLGLTFFARDRAALARHPFVRSLCRPLGGRVANVLRGEYEGREVEAFDVRPNLLFTTDQDAVGFERGAFSVFMLRHDADFPTVYIDPKANPGPLDRRLGYEAIDLESVEFSNAFSVSTRDRRVACSVCHPRMMAYLLEHRPGWILLEGNTLVLHFPRLLEPEEIPQRLKELAEIRNLLPAYLLAELRKESS